jgi:kumamolisin
MHTGVAGGAQSGITPEQLRNAYDISPLHNVGVQGDGQTLALFELDGYQPGDVAQYFQRYGIAAPGISNVLVDNFNGVAGQGAIEAQLDIEVAGAIAPRARQIVYEGPNTTQGINDIYNKIVSENKAQIVSVSWGLCENSSGTAELKTLDAILRQGAAQGMTFVAASGDSGAYDCQDNNLAVDSPADAPYVTGVGGTTLHGNGQSYRGESVWSDPSETQRGPRGGGSGGGISNFYKQPSWQNGPGARNQYSNGNRQVPDVSAPASSDAGGYSVYCTVTNAGCPQNGWLAVAGTSGAAPVWAGSLALVNQYRQQHGKSRVGQANPLLYSLFNSSQPFPPFHDVTTGTNLFYPATAGYDLASGIGSPDVANIARDLVPPNKTTAGGVGLPGIPLSLLQNNGFEAGPNPWQESSAQGYELVNNTKAHTGQNSTYLCGYMGCNDSISQTFNVPTDYGSVSVTYWWYSDTNKTDTQCLDTFSSLLLDASGNTIRSMQQSCNGDASNSWVKETYDISNDLANYRGKTVTLTFRGTNDPQQYQTTDFFVDDVDVIMV